MSRLTLNPQQLAAATHPGGPALVLAGAGAGKTRVIVERILWLVEKGRLDPRGILGLTFTNRAAREMRHRIEERLTEQGPGPWLGTFHAFGLYVLRREMKTLGRPRAFTLFDDADQLSMMKRLVKNLESPWEKVSPRDALSWISRLKQDLNSPDPEEACEEPPETTYRELWTRYHDVLVQASAVDFDDLLVLTARLFRDHPEALKTYCRRFVHILVDEYQDTNRAQYEIVRLLAGPGGNLFVVGDEDQSIYSWRGADVGNILNFESHFPETSIYRLEQNYRSTQAILDAANVLVAHNKDRLGKSLWTEQKGGEKVKFVLARDGRGEAEEVLEAIRKLGSDKAQLTVLYRTNGQSRLFEEALLKRNIAYAVVGGTRFYGRKEVKDLLAYLRLLTNPADEEAFRRIINVPPRGIGTVNLQRLEKASSLDGITLMEAVEQAAEDSTLSGRIRNAMQSFAHMIAYLTDLANRAKVQDVVEQLVEKIGYRDYLKKSDEKDFRSRIEIVDEFLVACMQYDEDDRGDLSEFLQDLSLATDADDDSAQGPAVTLMTCHSAKGLEFDHVFLVGLEEGLLPHANSLDTREAVEEERRLCYVSMTRARKTLVLSGAENRTIYGEQRAREISRFVDEIPESILERTKSAGGKGVALRAEGRVDGSQLVMGTKVRHAKFGVGRVMFTAGSGHRLKVRIRFDSGMARQFMVAAAPLEIVEKNK